MRRSPATSASGARPLVSVIVPAWNAEATLRATLGSVSRQTYPNLEIIIVDDGSTDGTGEIAEHYCRTEKRARLICKANGGVASARNRAISEAKGVWIAPIDADDLWHPTKIAKQVQVACSATELPGFVYCWSRAIDEHSRVRTSGQCWTVDGMAFSRLAYVNVVGNGSSLLALRHAILEAGGYDESLRARHAQGCEDMLLQLKIARRHPIAVTPEYLVGWRLHDCNMSSDFDQMARSFRLVIRSLEDEMARVPSRAVRWAASRYSFDLAQHRAAAGKFVASLWWLADAFRLDPVGIGLVTAYRALRSGLRRLSRSPARPLERFEDVEPIARIATDRHEIAGFVRTIEKLDSSRLKALATVEPLSRRFTGQHRARVEG